MRRRDFYIGGAGFGGAFLAGCGGYRAGDAGKPGGFSEERMLQDARNAVSYRKPKGIRNGFDHPEPQDHDAAIPPLETDVEGRARP